MVGEACFGVRRVIGQLWRLAGQLGEGGGVGFHLLDGEAMYRRDEVGGHLGRLPAERLVGVGDATAGCIRALEGGTEDSYLLVGFLLRPVATTTRRLPAGRDEARIRREDLVGPVALDAVEEPSAGEGLDVGALVEGVTDLPVAGPACLDGLFPGAVAVGVVTIGAPGTVAHVFVVWILRVLRIW